MFAAFDCLHQHDLKLVAWAAFICFVSVSAGLTAYGSALAKRGAQRGLWLAVAAVMFGSGVWATHFMAMLAFQPLLRVSFALGLTVLSGLVSILGLGLSLAVSAASRKPLGRALGGLLAGATFGLMHFTGLAAMHLPAEIAWDPTLLALSLAIAAGGGSAAMVTAGRMSSPLRALGAGALFVIAVCGLHFTAMSAATLILDPNLITTPDMFDRDQLAIVVGALTAMSLAAGAAIMTIDRFTAISALSSLRSALNKAPSAIAFFDPDDRLIFWNEGYGEILGSLGLTALHGLALQTFLERVAPDPEQRATLHTDLPATQIPDGRWLKPSVANTSDGGLALVLSDITGILALTQLEADARRQAEEASQAKSDFLANISHEIRTPLNAVLGMVQVMTRAAVDPVQVDRLKIIERASDDLLGIVNSLLEIGELETDQVAISERPFDLAETVGQAVAGMVVACRDSAVSFGLTISPEASGLWVGDPTRLSQVLHQLARNAVTFTDRGEVAVDVRCDESGRLAFEVVDTGCGIPEDRLVSIFDAFTQVDSSARRKVGGAGVGLPISRKLVALMGGELTVSSQVGRGSIFRFTLPLNRSSPSASAPQATEGNGAGCPLRILAAEDNAANRMVLAALLEPLEVDLTFAEDGQSAIDLCAGQTFDVVLMDIQMPNKTGIDAAREIRVMEALRSQPPVPIIAVTANVLPHQIAEYRDVGMSEWVAKPIIAADLADAIEAALTPAPDTASRIAA